MLLLNLAVLVFLFGFTLGKYSPHRWGKPRKWGMIVDCGPARPSDDPHWQREVAMAVNNAKVRGLIR